MKQYLKNNLLPFLFLLLLSMKMPASTMSHHTIESMYSDSLRQETTQSILSLLAHDDSVKTGPLQRVKVDVIVNDVLTCDDYEVVIVVPPPSTQGIADINGSEISFIPAPNFYGTVIIPYRLTCNNVEVTANVFIEVMPFNIPLNVEYQNNNCIEEIPSDIHFGIKRKFSTENGTPALDYCIDGFASPLVADLNGDGRPEIIALGVTGLFGGAARNNARYITIYNGQTGARMYRYDLQTNYPQSSGTGYHRPPSTLAIADLDKDGIAEIVYTPSDGEVFAFKLIFNGTTITGMTKLWQANVNFKAPLAVSTGIPFNVPHPYIADINGDGIPEVVVYNKVYNGQTGALLMAWQGASPTPNTPVYSSLAANVGLVDRTSITSTSSSTSSGGSWIKSVAMTGRRPSNYATNDPYITTPVVWDIDGDGIQEIITGSRIYKIQINDTADHTKNTYTSIEGPEYVDLTENTNGTKTRHYLSDGFTRVADIDGDGHLDIIVATICNAAEDSKILVYVWDWRYPSIVKAAITYYTDNQYGSFGIPFIGDINGRNDGWDGLGYNLKLPEICIISGTAYINRTTGNGGRTGIKFHSTTDSVIRRGTAANSGTAAGWDNNQVSNPNRRFNRANNFTSLCGHILAFTYDAAETDIENRLKISWAMEHADRSQCTGITLFDFNNDGAKDLCYKDETKLRVISPAKGNYGAGIDYVTSSETVNTPGTSIMFSTPLLGIDAVFGGTGFEFPTIADVNLDGSADILVTRNSNAITESASQGYIMVFEYDGEKWASCPSVWNQNLYNPLHINADLTIPAKPQSLLAKYVNEKGDSITPYNGAWIQQPIVKEGSSYTPIARTPDASITDVKVTATTTSAEVAVTICNFGAASINANTPISFYLDDTLGTKISTKSVGVDLFPKERMVLTYTLNGNFQERLIWVRIMDNGTGFPAIGYGDCDLSNNIRAGIDCPGMQFAVSTSSSSIICGDNSFVELKTDYTTPQYASSIFYQWCRNEQIIPDATDSVYYAVQAGNYKVYIIDSLCQKFSEDIIITKQNTYLAQPENIALHHGDTSGIISFSGKNFNAVTWTASPAPIAAKIGMPTDSSTGNIPEFVAINTGYQPDTVWITATPISYPADCSHEAKTFTIIVAPQSILCGTVFPFVYHKYNANDDSATIAQKEFLNTNFSVTAALYAVPAVHSTDDPIGTVLQSQPLYTAEVKPYDTSYFMPNTPKNPGTWLSTTNPGHPIHWEELIYSYSAENVDSVYLKDGEIPLASIGMYVFKDVQAGDYILVLSRTGYVTRFAEVSCTLGGKFVGHKELIPADVKDIMYVNNASLSEAKRHFTAGKQAEYQTKYDLNADGEVNGDDFSAIIQFTGFSTVHYVDTRNWVLKYFVK